jgi:ribonuclease HI
MKTQRRALLLICAAFRTTPTEALEIEASIPPLHLQIQRQKELYATRLNKLPTSSPIIQRLGNNWRYGKKPKLSPPLPMKRFNGSKVDNQRTTPLLELEKMSSPSQERIIPFLVPPWRETFNGRLHFLPHRPTTDENSSPEKDHLNTIKEIGASPANIVVYTDGSRNFERGFTKTGAASVVYHENVEVNTNKMSLGGRATSFDAEMAGLMLGAKIASKYGRRRTLTNHIYIFVDNTSAIHTTAKLNPGPGQLYAAKSHQYLAKFLRKSPDNQVTIAWCPGHKNITGNERADVLAKEARDEPNSSNVTGTVAHSRKVARARTRFEWRKEWRKNPKTGGYAPANRIPPDTKISATFKDTPREVFGRMIQCKTNHGYTGEFRKRFNRDEDLGCPCGEIYQTREHILAHCRLHEAERGKLWKASRDIWLPTILGTKDGTEALKAFLSKSNAFTRNGQQPKKPPIPVFEEEPDDEEDTLTVEPHDA